MDTIRYWTDAVLECNRRDHTMTTGHRQRGPFRSARGLGMAMIAMHDAWFAVTGGEQPYHATGTPGIGATPGAAAAVACDKVLRDLYPGQLAELQAGYDHYAGAHAVSAQSRTLGEAVAAKVLQWRAGDAAFMGDAFTPTKLAFDHDEDPFEPGQKFHGPAWGNAPPFVAPVQPFAIPPGADSTGGFNPGAHYFAEYAEVKAKGRDTGGTRTPEEEEIGIFWGYDGASNLGTPPRLYMQVALTVLDGIAARPHSWLDEAGMLKALTATAVAMADAGIQAWRYKYSEPHMMWRPVLGIHKATHPRTPVDPNWRPLGKPVTNGTDLNLTPNFPAYPSGHATFGAAAFEILRRYIRRNDATYRFTDDEEDNIAFTFVSDEYDGMNKEPRTGKPRPRKARYHRSLWQAIVDNSESRIFLGVHWRFDGISKKNPNDQSVFGRPDTPGNLGLFGGTRLGMDIAKAIAEMRGFD